MWLLFCKNMSWEGRGRGGLSSLAASPTYSVEAAGRPGFLLEFLLHPVRPDCLHPAACGRSLSSRLPAAAHSTDCWQHSGRHRWSTAAPAHHMTNTSSQLEGLSLPGHTPSVHTHLEVCDGKHTHIRSDSQQQVGTDASASQESQHGGEGRANCLRSTRDVLIGQGW